LYSVSVIQISYYSHILFRPICKALLLDVLKLTDCIKYSTSFPPLHLVDKYANLVHQIQVLTAFSTSSAIPVSKFGTKFHIKWIEVFLRIWNFWYSNLGPETGYRVPFPWRGKGELYMPNFISPHQITRRLMK
jgi:hypothetical protein